MELISSKNVKARIEHICDTCGSKIYKNEEYNYQTNTFEGRIYNWKQCYHCESVTDKMFKEGYYPDGVTEQDFIDFITDNGIEFNIR